MPHTRGIREQVEDGRIKESCVGAQQGRRTCRMGPGHAHAGSAGCRQQAEHRD